MGRLNRLASKGRLSPLLEANQNEVGLDNAERGPKKAGFKKRKHIVAFLTDVVC